MSSRLGGWIKIQHCISIAWPPGIDAMLTHPCCLRCRANGGSMRLLLVEDEMELAKLIAGAVVRQGMIIDHVTSIAMAQEAVANAAYDAIILDRMLPDGDGLSTLPQL